MELSDYDILGIPKNSTFKVVKNAYYDLSKIYHPDSISLSTEKVKLSKQERKEAFHKIQKAYSNIKKKLNVVEVDLPKTEIKYHDEKTINNNPELSNVLNISKDEFNKKFNKLFKEVGSRENIDNPYSIYYNEPVKNKRNLCDTQLSLNSSSINKSSSIYEFGINYVEDHSTDLYMDIRKINNQGKLNNNRNTTSIESIKETIDSELDKKFENLLKSREESFEMTESEYNFIKKQKEIRNNIEKSKKQVVKERNKKFLN